MLLRSRCLRNIHDPAFMRSVKRAQNRYKESMGTSHKDAVSGEAYVDVTDRGPAWYLGHMNVAKRELQTKLRHTDFVLEVRDARVPFTTANPDIDELIQDIPRLIVFNKSDLANEQCNTILQEYYEARGSHVLFTNARVAWRATMETVVRFVQVCVPPVRFKTVPHLGVIVGMPNVGKSTLINALRISHEYQFMKRDYRKARDPQQVSMTPGTTRNLTTVPICLDPPISLCDTPGLTLPGNFSAAAGRKLALLGIIPPSASSMPVGLLAKQVYDVLTQSGMTNHLAECLRISRIPVSFDDCIHLLSERSGRSGMNQLNNVNQENSLMMLVTDFMEGRLGRFTLDPLPRAVSGTKLNASGGASKENDGQYSWRDTEVETKDLDKDKDVPESMREVLSKIEMGCETISRKKGSIKEERLPYQLRRAST